MSENVTYTVQPRSNTTKTAKASNIEIWFLHTASPQQGDLRRSSGQGAGGGARTRDRGFPADLRADSLATVPPTPRPLLMIAIIIDAADPKL
ncbi:hypothetical protein PoB_001755100 [Plakobranchus ocellatus]|uniref:Uncharacterized protein n=1 Tax=Plakobranchus ocellatus TaxID=259542 RepID=A0AAV3Z8U5_9GAST|nr:hypothetical protein PoB_001755100 [Plakobranchus ocellatus]